MRWLKQVIFGRGVMWLTSLTALIVLISLGNARADVTLDSLLDEMTDFSSVSRWPQPAYTCRQFSSYDRAKIASDKPGWFANNDHNQFIRDEQTDGRKEHVMMDADGPGCIVRFWLTAGGDKQGVLRVYLDGNPTPALSFPAFDLLAGDMKIAAPLAQPHPGYSPQTGGNNLYLPIPYARHCKVTWEEKSNGERYYQINYRTYSPGTAVQTFSRENLEAARPHIARVCEELMSPPQVMAGQASVLQERIAAGKTITLDLPEGPAAVRMLEMHVTADDSSNTEQALRSTILQLQCDGEDTIWCPASDFFGSGVGINQLSSWYRTIRADGMMICRWVMPYQKTGRLSISNVGAHSVKVELRATTSSCTWDERAMHFHTAWHYESDLQTPPLRDWNFIHIAGRGVYVGDTLALFNPVATWYGEGDEKISVDGESFPSHMGTGTEDYYDYSYAPKGIIQTPFANQVRVDQPMTQGHNVLTRTRNLDGIPFEKSLNFDFELISWKPTNLTCAATTYWYAFPAATSNVKPQPQDAARHIATLAEAIAAVAAAARKPGAIECETMKVLSKSGNFFVGEQDMEPFGRQRWSNGKHLLSQSRSLGDFAEIEFPAPDASPKKLLLYATQAPDYATLRFTINGKVVPAKFDGYAESVRPAEVFPLGVFEPRDGKFILRAEVVGANPAANGAKYFFGLDCIILDKP